MEFNARVQSTERGPNLDPGKYCIYLTFPMWCHLSCSFVLCNSTYHEIFAKNMFQVVLHQKDVRLLNAWKLGYHCLKTFPF